MLFAINVFRGEKISSAFMFAVALAVAAIPEALSSIVTIVLSFGTQKMAKEHAIIRKLQAVEGLGSVSVICSDKTGTLTQNKMTVEDYYIEEFGKKLSVLILVFCGMLFAINVFRGEKISSAFMFAVALAVAAIPEALSSIVTIVLSFGTQKMAKEHAIIRKLQAVEGLGSVSVICSDKTGTLTQNKMTVEDYYIEGKRIPAAEIDITDPAQNYLLECSIYVMIRRMKTEWRSGIRQKPH